jgi:hypothetical protein
MKKTKTPSPPTFSAGARGGFQFLNPLTNANIQAPRPKCQTPFPQKIHFDFHEHQMIVNWKSGAPSAACMGLKSSCRQNSAYLIFAQRSSPFTSEEKNGILMPIDGWPKSQRSRNGLDHAVHDRERA